MTDTPVTPDAAPAAPAALDSPLDRMDWIRGDGPLEPPFAVRGGRSFLVTYLATWKLAALVPGRFFGRMRTDRSGAAVLFGLLSGSVGLFVSSFYSALNRLHWWDASRDVKLELGPERGHLVDELLPYFATGYSFAEALTAPVKVLVGIYAGAAIIHLALVALRGRNAGFDTTLTVVGYAFGLSLLTALPVCGFPLVAVWMLLVLVLGVAAAQRTAAWKAAVAVLTPGLVVILFGFRPWLAGMFTLVRTLQGALGGGPG
jgi:hypothetical protein